MAFTAIQSLDADVVVAVGGVDKKTGKKNPTSVEGYYLGNRKIESRKAKSGFSYIHFFQTPEGNVGVWGKTDSDRKLQQVTPGTMTKLQFKGMKATPNGDMYTFEVLVDKTNTIDVDLAASGNYSDDSGDSASNSEGNDSYDTDDAYEEPTTIVAQPAADRSVRVKDLLSKTKRA